MIERYFPKFHEFWNREIGLRIKAVAYSVMVMGLLVGGFERQSQGINAERIQSQCVTRVETRDDLRAVLFKVVDLSDLFDPATITARQKAFVARYAGNRIDFINAKYPALSKDDC